MYKFILVGIKFSHLFKLVTKTFRTRIAYRRATLLMDDISSCTTYTRNFQRLSTVLDSNEDYICYTTYWRIFNRKHFSTLFKLIRKLFQRRSTYRRATLLTEYREKEFSTNKLINTSQLYYKLITKIFQQRSLIIELRYLHAEFSTIKYSILFQPRSRRYRQAILFIKEFSIANTSPLY